MRKCEDPDLTLGSLHRSLVLVHSVKNETQTNAGTFLLEPPKETANNLFQVSLHAVYVPQHFQAKFKNIRLNKSCVPDSGKLNYHSEQVLKQQRCVRTMRHQVPHMEGLNVVW